MLNELLYRRQPKIITIWIFLIIILLLLFFLVSIYFEYNPHYQLSGLAIKKEEILIQTLIKNDDLYVLNSSELLIDDKSIKYEVNEIGLNYYSDTGIIYKELLIKLDNKEFKENDTILLNFRLPKTTIMKEITKKIKKGMNM